MWKYVLSEVLDCDSIPRKCVFQRHRLWRNNLCWHRRIVEPTDIAAVAAGIGVASAWNALALWTVHSPTRLRQKSLVSPPYAHVGKTTDPRQAAQGCAGADAQVAQGHGYVGRARKPGVAGRARKREHQEPKFPPGLDTNGISNYPQSSKPVS